MYNFMFVRKHHYAFMKTSLLFIQGGSKLFVKNIKAGRRDLNKQIS